MRASVLVCAGNDGEETVVALGVGFRAAPAQESGIGVHETRIERIAENTVAVGLPDFNDRVSGRLAAFFEHPPGERNVWTLRALAIGERQIVAAVDETGGEERTDGAVRRSGHR